MPHREIRWRALSKRFALATLLAACGSPAAAEPPAKLQAVPSTPEFRSPAEPSAPADETPETPAEANQVTTQTGGWSARVRVAEGPKLPALAEPSPGNEGPNPVDDGPAAAAATPQPAAENRAKRDAEPTPASDRSSRSNGSVISLEGLQPVPLMSATGESIGPGAAATQDRRPRAASPTADAPAARVARNAAPVEVEANAYRRFAAGREADGEAGETGKAGGAEPPESAEVPSLEAKSDSASEMKAASGGKGLQLTGPRNLPVRRPDVSGADAAAQGAQARVANRDPENRRSLPGLEKRRVESAPKSTRSGAWEPERYVGDLDRQDEERGVADDAAGAEAVESETMAEDGTSMRRPTAQSQVMEDEARPAVTAAAKRIQPALEATLRYFYNRPEKAPERSSWGMLHSVMVYGVDTQVLNGRRRYNLIAWLAGNNVCRGQRIFGLENGNIAPKNGVGLQGHQGQFLSIFALVGVSSEYPLYVNRQAYSMTDLIRHEQDRCRADTELTFTLIGLAHYLDTDATWKSDDGQTWDFERLLEEELAQPVIGAACGGTHRLMGLSHALRIRRQQGKPITGQWARADQFVKDFVDYAWRLQNPDGSMSTDWFEGRANRNDIDRKIQTTGHIIEWLIGVTPRDELQDPRMLRAIRFLANSMYRYRTRDWEIGPKGHALRSLALYHQRVFSETPPWRQETRQRSVHQSRPSQRNHRR